ncbi:MAG TPA: hypothetical protein VHD90_17415 [Phototrophicaceae bacterium]|nr:hypothetical protein [Phototrophicaceae bacterium]
MAIDYIIDYDCVPKQTLTTEGILERLKARARAEEVIRLFRVNGDQRPPSQMGFEFTRSNREGEEENRVIVVQEMLDQAAELDPLEHYCVGCPANRKGEPFGCIDQIEYPISAAAERWLLDQLPGLEQPLIWLLLRQGIQELGYDGASVRPLRASEAYFEERRVAGRDMSEFVMTADQVFEMVFLLGTIQPAHAGVLLLFFNAIPRDLETAQIVQIMNHALSTEEIAQQYPFQMRHLDSDDRTISELKTFFRALYRAWSLNLPLLLDV